MSKILVGKDFNEKIRSLKKVRADGSKWEVYYTDTATGEKWIEDYPSSEYHGGGPPRLRMVEKFPWEEEKLEDLIIEELDKLYNAAFDLQERASKALWKMLEDREIDPSKKREFEDTNAVFHEAYDELVDALRKAGNKYSVALGGTLLEIDKPFIGFRNGLAIVSTRTNTRIHRDLNDL
jgi:hypothetical protein